jgi:signal transduction histidine kinase
MENIELKINNTQEKELTIEELQKKLVVAEKLIEDLKKSNKQKDEHISLATHQIRGPLAAIKGYVSLLTEGDYGLPPEGFTEPLHIIYESAVSLSKTVNDFLADSQMEQGAMKYYRKDFDFSRLVKEVFNELRKTIDHKLDLKLNIPETELKVHGDKTKLKQVLLNLLDNASKYTNEGWIEISLKQLENKVLFSIKDSGVGIKEETLPLLFQKFSRSSDASKSNIHGTGLGLYVAKRMIENHNGRIWAESEGEGKGSQFHVKLDLVKQTDKI